MIKMKKKGLQNECKCQYENDTTVDHRCALSKKSIKQSHTRRSISWTA